MGLYTRLLFVGFTLTLYASWCGSVSQSGVFHWLVEDRFDEIMDRMSSVTADNCRSKPKDKLRLPMETVSQLPRYNMLLSTVIYSNRSQLLHLHNMALNRAFFYSFIYQRQNRSEDFMNQPGLQYLYMAATADVTGSEGFINGSALYFDNHCSYPQWYLYNGVEFNKTLPLFGPRAWRTDDYNEPTNWLREPTNNTVDIHDYGAGTMKNYTSDAFKAAPWYSAWLPDDDKSQDSLRKFTYFVNVKFSNATGQFTHKEFEGIDFFGPPQPGQSDRGVSLPVEWTMPYFDCGRSNRWIVSAHSPVVEYMPRYSNWTHLRRPRFVAVVTQDIEFERIDFNPCPKSEGNPDPNYFKDTARCKPTTMCEPLNGYGFRRGGYQCVCRPGYYFPWWHGGPFLGDEIEIATEDEYMNNFDCLPVEELQVIPNEMPTFVQRRRKRSTLVAKKSTLFNIITSQQSPRVKLVARRAVPKDSMKEKLRNRRHIPRYEGQSKKVRNKRDLFDADRRVKMDKILLRKAQTNSGNCKTKMPYELFLPGDVAFGVEKQFEAQGRTALRLAHFLSDFLQNVDEYENFGSMTGDRRLNETHLFGEVIANVMSDFKILGSGVFFERYKFRMSPPINNTDPRFTNGIVREFFGPYAWRKQTKTGDGLDEFFAVDSAGYSRYYTDEVWYRTIKSRWQTNFHSLIKYTAKPMVRSDVNGTSLVRFEYYPIQYYAPKYEHGEWLRPEFKCDDRVMDWVVTYVVPFFGFNELKTMLEFKGVVKVDVKLDYLDINQCPQDFYVANAFKNTAKCDFKSTYCIPIPGKRFQTGSYKCECRQGYEYPFNDLAWFYDGQTMEEEYSKKLKGEPNRYGTLKCRIAGAASVVANWILMSGSFLAFLLLQRW
ncbi:uncharacterized protein [Argopecten irradians]|uniref:uncharacterized protein n=1 Tax=Argopecten irradians TaxID=31199 RepID=UPI00371EFB02